MGASLRLKPAVIWGLITSLYLYFLLPLTSLGFYELYHLIGGDPVYWLYAGFKVAAVFLPQWAYFELAAGGAGLAVAATVYWWPWRKRD